MTKQDGCKVTFNPYLIVVIANNLIRFIEIDLSDRKTFSLLWSLKNVTCRGTSSQKKKDISSYFDTSFSRSRLDEEHPPVKVCFYSPLLLEWPTMDEM